MILGLTGGIATGKSTVSALFKQRGAFVIDADQVARQVVEPGTEGLEKVAFQFGQQVIGPDGYLNRAALAEIIFHDTEARKKLNRILHPLILREIERQTQSILWDQPQAIVIWDIPLLIEEKWDWFVEKVIVVYVPESIQLKRLMERDQLSMDEARKRISAQLNMETKKWLADWVIDNSGTREETERQVDQLWDTLR